MVEDTLDMWRDWWDTLEQTLLKLPTSQQLALLDSLFLGGKSPIDIITQNFLKFLF